jgi:hypothetical protein
MTNQYIDQLPLTVRQAIFGNVGTLGSFVVSQSDASILEKEFAPVVSSDDLVSLDSHAMYVKLCIDGMTSIPFSAKSLPVRYQKFDCKQEIIEKSREKYGMDRLVIEDKIQKWSSQTYSEKGNRSVSVNNEEHKTAERKEYTKPIEKKEELKAEPKKEEVKREESKVEPKKEDEKKKYTIKI